MSSTVWTVVSALHSTCTSYTGGQALTSILWLQNGSSSIKWLYVLLPWCQVVYTVEIVEVTSACSTMRCPARTLREAGNSSISGG